MLDLDEYERQLPPLQPPFFGRDLEAQRAIGLAHQLVREVREWKESRREKTIQFLFEMRFGFAWIGILLMFVLAAVVAHLTDKH